MSFVDALKIWNKDKDVYCIPRRGGKPHREVLEIMKGLPKRSKAKKGSGMKRLGGDGMSRLGGCMKCELSAADEKKVHKLGMGLKRLGYSYERPQRGGFLPALLAMLPSLGTVGTAVGSALSGAAAGKLLDGIANVASGKNFFTGKGHESCFCHHLVRNKDYNKCKKCAGINGGNIMDIVPFFTRQVEALAKNPFVKEALKQGKAAASNVAGLDVKGLEDAVKRVVKGRGMKKKKEINNKITQIINPIRPLSNIEINDYFKLINLSSYLGTYPKNLLKNIDSNKLKKDFSTIINLDGEGSGTHWVMVCKRGDELLYFDSFGVEFIDSNIMDFINKCKCKKRYMNYSQIQDYDSILCGYYCCKVIKNIFIDNIDLKDCLKMFKERPSDLNKDLADNLHI